MSPNPEVQLFEYQFGVLQFKVNLSLWSSILDLISRPNPNAGGFNNVVKSNVIRSILSLTNYDIN